MGRPHRWVLKIDIELWYICDVREIHKICDAKLDKAEIASTRDYSL